MVATQSLAALRPYAELDEETQRVLEEAYRYVVETQAPIAIATLRHATRASRARLDELERLGLLHEANDAAGKRGLVPSLWGCLYLPSAEGDLELVDTIIRYAHSRYSPSASAVVTRDELMQGLDKRPAPSEQTLRRVGLLSADLNMSVSDLSLSLQEWNAEIGSLRQLLEARWAFGDPRGGSINQAAFVPFRLVLTEVRATRVRALRHITMPLHGLTVLVGRNGAGKSTLLDVFGLLAMAAREGLGAAISAEGGLQRLRTRESSGPMSIGFTATLDYGDERPVTVSWDATIDAVEKHIVVEREVLLVDGATIIDARRGRARLVAGDGREEERYLSPASLVLTSEIDPEKHPLIAQLRLALTRMVLIDRDPIVLEGATLEWFGRSPESSRRRLPTKVTELLAPIAADESRTRRLGAYLSQLVPSVADVSRVVRTGEQTTLRVVEKGGAGSFALDELSAGTRQMLLLAALCLQDDPPAVVLLEEPDAGVHPAAHAALVDLLRSLALKTTVVATTHSPAFVSLLDAGREVVVLDRDGGEVRTRPLSTAIEQERWLSSYAGGSEAFTHLQVIRTP